MKAVVLIGGVSAWLYPLAEHRPRSLLRVGDRPALAHLLEHLARNGVTEAFIPLGPGLEAVRGEIGPGTGKLRIHYAVERKFNGAAAGAGLFRDQLADAPFLLINGNAFSRLDLRPLFSAPPDGAPFLNVGVYAGVEGPRSFGVTRTTAVRMEVRNPVFWEGHPQASAHAWVLHPRLLDLIPRGKYCDMREQLIPGALKAGIAVRGVPLEGSINEMRTLQDFLRANDDVVREAHAAGVDLIAPDAEIAPTAILSGPVMVGEKARIGPDCLVVGPAVIGPFSVLGRGAMVCQSALGPRSRIGNHSRITRGIVFRDAKVLPGRTLSRAVVLGGKQLMRGHLHMLKEVADGASWRVVTGDLQDRFHVTDRWWYRLCKRTTDVALTLLAAPVAATLSLLLGAVVKATSPGPAFYREKRMTRGGREFWMLKLRTMYVDAHIDQDDLRAQNQTDGPMFKILDDPRITAVGRWLRKTSLDELPQLWNVLKGEMSLVGPRPLADRETRWHPVWRGLRLRVRPGMTGLWQVKCGGYSDFADWIAYDVHYIQNACMSLDFWLLLKTVGVVFFGRRTAED